MCGIAGTFSYATAGASVDATALVKVRDYMARRGPDGAGLWISPDQRVGLAHRRLSIIDLSEAGAQPMASADGRLQIVFNGEIYNYRELRSELEARGRRFRSQSDTEVLLHLYAEHGEGMLPRLRGMYAFALWDERRWGLLLARDPFGIKPLYYVDNGSELHFASQVKALLAHGGVRSAPEPAGYAGFLLWGFVPEPYTLHRNVLALPAGSALWIDRSGPREPDRFLDLAEVLASAAEQRRGLEPAQSAELLRSAVADSVRHHLIADVPVGVFLSGGLDSTTLTALAAEQQADLRTFTLGFREHQDRAEDEVPAAETVAALYRTRHVTRWIDKREFQADREKLLAAMDQPSVDGVNSYFVAKAAAEGGLKAAISGLGGDELFGGYPSFRQIPALVRTMRMLPAALQRGGRHASAVLAPVLGRLTSPKYANVLEHGATYGGAYLLRRGLFMPWEIEQLMDSSVARDALERLATIPQLDALAAKLGTPGLKVAALEMNWFMRSQLLRDMDWASMAHSLEVRVPLLDVELLRKVAPLAAGKQDLARTPRVPLPAAVLARPKTGFSVPVRDWLAETMPAARHARGVRGWAIALMDAEPQFPRPPTLVFRIGQLGDTLVALPALAQLRRDSPGRRIVLLTENYASARNRVSAWDVVNKTGWVDDVLAYDVDLPFTQRLRQRLAIARRIRELRPSRVISLAPHRTAPQRLRDHFVFRVLLGISQVHGVWAGSMKRPPALRPMQRLEPEWRRLQKLVQADPERAPTEEFRLPLTTEEADEARRLLAAKGIGQRRPLIAVGAGSKMPAKRWPRERFAEVLERVQQRFPSAGVVLLGGPDEAAYCGELVHKAGLAVVNLAGELSIRGSAAILARCDAYLGNDTGVMHLAAAVGTKCVAIFSARDFPGIWEPMGSGHRVLRQETECAGCMLVECTTEDMRCLKAITSDAVWRELLAVLDHESVERRRALNAA
jgi:asparagine synthase (glutamine-hydrolysing)